jgi:hypothetical protein
VHPSILENHEASIFNPYDYETGGVWVYIYAESPGEIHSKFRDLTVYESPPKWMSETERQDIETRSLFDLETVETQHPTFAGLLRKTTEGV